jgi:hypothetical protein
VCWEMFSFCAYLKRPSEQSFHRVPSWLAHVSLHVAIGSQRKGHRRMTEHLGHDEFLHAFQKQQGGCGMPEVMWPDIGQPCFLKHRDIVPRAKVRLRVGGAR